MCKKPLCYIRAFTTPPPTPLSFRACERGGQGVKMGFQNTTPLTHKKKKLQDSALPVSWEVYYLELCEKRQRRRFAGKCIRTLELLIAY